MKKYLFVDIRYPSPERLIPDLKEATEREAAERKKLVASKQNVGGDRKKYLNYREWEALVAEQQKLLKIVLHSRLVVKWERKME